MKLTLSRQFDGYIWHIAPGPGNRLALEIRYDDSLQVRFVEVDLLTGDQAAYDSNHIDWWTSLVRLDDEGMILKKFNDDKDPSKHRYCRLSPAGSWREVEALTGPDSTAVSPHFYRPGTNAFQMVEKYLATHKIAATAGAEYTEWNDYVVIGYYRAHDQLLDRYLLALDNDGSEMFHEKIDSGMQGVVFESFFTFTNYLVFVKERKELHVYRA